MSGLDQRAALLALADRQGLSLVALSRMLRRNPAYLQQFVTRGSPRELAERDRRLLADVLQVDEAELGGERKDGAVRLPRMDVAASAGPGAFVDTELVIGTDTIDPALARSLGLREGQAGVIRARGVSMEPTLRDGDHLVVDLAGRTPGRKPAVYVIRVDGAVMVKRVARMGTRLVATSDNPAADPVPHGPVEVVGRVVWRMGRLD